MQLLTEIGRPGIALLAVIAFLAFTGPMGTYALLDAPQRLGFWGFVTTGNWVLMVAARFVFIRLAPPDRIAPIVPLVLAGLCAALPGVLLVALGEILFAIDSSVYPWSLRYVTVAMLMVLIAIVMYYVRGGRSLLEATAGAQESEAARPREHGFDQLLRRLPEDFGTDIVYIKSSDHYVEVHAPHRQQMLLMRFGDCVSELAGADGIKVHRSYWVARRHVKKLFRRDGKPWLLLSNGTSIPVSRTYLPEVREAGWAL